MNTNLKLFLSFAKIGAFTFGGGYAMLPMLVREVQEKHGWVTEEELLNYFAVGQCTPGIIAVNTATFVGRKVGGTLGAVCATAGVIMPSFFIILILALFLTRFDESPVLQSAFSGIRVAVVVLILSAVLKLWKKSIKDIWTFLLYLAVLALDLFTSVSPVILVLGAALLGVAVEFVRGRRRA